MSRDNCVFCKIVSNEIPVKPVLINGHAIMIADAKPIAPHHMLVISRRHFGDIGDLDMFDGEDVDILADMFDLIDDYVATGLFNDGYRLVINTGKNAGQTVKHLHIHLLAGAELKNDFGA